MTQMYRFWVSLCLSLSLFFYLFISFSLFVSPILCFSLFVAKIADKSSLFTHFPMDSLSLFLYDWQLWSVNRLYGRHRTVCCWQTQRLNECWPSLERNFNIGNISPGSLVYFYIVSLKIRLLGLFKLVYLKCSPIICLKRCWTGDTLDPDLKFYIIFSYLLIILYK